MKKLFSLLALLFLLAGQAQAAITDGGKLGSNGVSSSGTTLGVTLDTLAVLAAGDIGIIAVALDNTATSDGNTSEITSVTDTGGNTWAALRAFRNGQGGAAAGAQTEIWLTKAATQLTTLDTITVTFANTITSKSAIAWKFAVTSGNSLQIAAGGSGVGFLDLVGDNANAVNLPMTLASLPSKEYLFFRGNAIEATAPSWTATGGSTTIGTQAGSSGTNATSMGTSGEFLIATATGLTSDATAGNTGRDWACTILALEEYSVGGGASCSGGLAMMGVGC